MSVEENKLSDIQQSSTVLLLIRARVQSARDEFDDALTPARIQQLREKYNNILGRLQTAAASLQTV